MNRDELVSAIAANGRFNATSQVGSMREWLKQALSIVWDEADWTFKRADDVDAAVTAGNELLALPSDYGHGLQVFGADGGELEELSRDDFNRSYADTLNLPNGTPAHYVRRDGQIVLGPKPDVSTTFKLAYRRAQFCFASDGVTVKAGANLFAAATDVPPFHPLSGKYHYVLVHAACAIGLAMENDPSAVTQEDMRDGLLVKMLADPELLRPATRKHLQYGRQ